MEMQMEELQLENHFFRFDLRDPQVLREHSYTILNDGEAAFLESNQYQSMPGIASDVMRGFQSAATDDVYLVIAIVERYRFLFFIHDQPSFIAWQQKYGSVGVMLPGMILPPPSLPVDANTTKIHIDAAAWRRTFRG